MQSTWLDKLERKFRKFSIPNLMNLILVGMAVVFLSDIFLSVQYGTTLSSYLYFSRSAIFHGEVWRILSFLFIPINSSPIWILFSMYFYWLIGSGLEREWGSFRFNVFYLCGAIGTILSGLITGYVGNTYLNFSLFLAFACTFPEMQFLLIFIPIRAKYLGMMYGALLVYSFLTGGIIAKIEIVVSMLNFIIFFLMTRNYRKISPKEAVRKQKFKNEMQKISLTRHKCAVCGRTEKDDPNLEFRYCSKCAGNMEYCMDHLYTHKHVTEEELKDSK